MGRGPLLAGSVVLGPFHIALCCLVLVSGGDNTPKTHEDVKIINAGRILEDAKTLAESRVPVGEVLGAPITMHVVLRPPHVEKPEGEALSLL